MRKFLAAALLALWPTLAPAQSPSPVPALPDAPRLTQYSIVTSTCNCPVNFALYGDSTDVDNWVQVFIGTTRYLSTDPLFGWVLSSPSGSLGNIARPITDAVLNFNATQSGSVTILGARRPRRTTQFLENRGVPARDLNQAVTDLIAMERENWDRDNRAIKGQPGEVLNLLAPAASRAGAILTFDGSGQPLVSAPPAGTGNVVGPASPTNNDLVCFNGVTGTLIKDCGFASPVPVANGGTGDTGTAWTTFTPSPSCGTATFTVNSARSKTLGKTTWLEADFTITTLGTCTATLTFTLPLTANSVGTAPFVETVNSSGLGICRLGSVSATSGSCFKSAAANYAANDRIIFSGVYENQ